MKLGDVLRPVGTLFRARARRVTVGTTRAHVEFRDVSDAELAELSRHVRRAVEQMDDMEWVEVNALTRRVVFAYRADAYSSDELGQIVEEAERLARVAEGVFDEDFRDHPADHEPALRHLVELVADIAGFSFGLGLRVSPIPALPMSGNLVAVLSVVRSSPRLRRGLEERLGKARAQFFLNLTSSLAQGVAQRPMSSMVDGLHKLSLVGERQAMRRAWEQREPELCAAPTAPVVGHAHIERRPRPLPLGPIEEYSERAWFVSLSGFALSFLTTRSIQRATAALFGAFPRPARLGRDVFAAQLNRDLAARGILCLDHQVLRRFDRVDCLVLQGDLIDRNRFVIAGVRVEDPEEAEDARARAIQMFDGNHPLVAQHDDLWSLLPWEMSQATADMQLQAHAAQRSTDGALVLSLERAGRAVAVVEVEVIHQTGIEELMASARQAQMRVVVAGLDEAALTGVDADDVIRPEEGLVQGIRRLQREGRGVCLVATGSTDALAVADCSIGMLRANEPIPWGSHIICREDLAHVRYIIEAMIVGRRVSKQCVNIALGAATMGALVSAGGLLPLTTRRVLFVVNGATLIAMANGVRHTSALQRKQLKEPADPTPWHALDAVGAMKRLGTNRRGLSRTEVVRREVNPERVPSALTELGEAISDELFNPLAPLLAAGAGLSAIVGSFTDAGMVAGVVGVNAVVGGVQRFSTERRIQRLTREERRRALVRRDNIEYTIAASELVRGDIVVLAAGDIVPADCRVIESSSLEVDASSLTGESLPVPKSAAASFEPHVADRSSMLFEGTSIAAGRAVALVVATGTDTESRRGAAAAKNTRAQGGVEKRLRALMDVTGPVALAAGIGVVGGGLLRGRKMEDLVGSGVSLAVASVPEGLPVLATAAQLSAAQRLSERKALVRNARSIEALGRVDVVCLDKTGTVTRGLVELSLVSDGQTEQELGSLLPTHLPVLSAALRACPEPGGVSASDPMDEAVRRASLQEAVNETYDVPAWRRSSEISFEAGRSYHATLAEVTAPDASALISIKGAPEVILPLCDQWRCANDTRQLDDDSRYAVAAEASQLASNGLRVVAVAEGRRGCTPESGDLQVDDIRHLTLLGLLAFSDPVRPTAAQAVAGMRRAGVATVMLTGDHPSTARAIATELGLLDERRLLTGVELAELTDPELDQVIQQIGVFARVTPTQKVRVVRALQRAGRVVGMAGDGANDAPALRLADVGIAIGEHSTAAARGAADVVLADGRVETLVAAIAEGRAMWTSVRDAVSILLGGNFGEIGFTMIAGLIDGRPPLNARQLLLVNLLTDVAPAMAIALRPPSSVTLESLANATPEEALGSPLTRDMAERALITAGGAGAAWLVARVIGGHGYARTVGLAALVGTQLGQTVRTGGLTRGVVLTSVGSAALMGAIIQTPGISHFFGCRPLGPFGWGTAIGASAVATAMSGRLSQWLVESRVYQAAGQLPLLAERTFTAPVLEPPSDEA